MAINERQEATELDNALGKMADPNICQLNSVQLISLTLVILPYQSTCCIFGPTFNFPSAEAALRYLLPVIGTRIYSISGELSSRTYKETGTLPFCGITAFSAVEAQRHKVTWSRASKLRLNKK